MKGGVQRYHTTRATTTYVARSGWSWFRMIGLLDRKSLANHSCVSMLFSFVLRPWDCSSGNAIIFWWGVELLKWAHPKKHKVDFYSSIRHTWIIRIYQGNAQYTLGRVHAVGTKRYGTGKGNHGIVRSRARFQYLYRRFLFPSSINTIPR